MPNINLANSKPKLADEADSYQETYDQIKQKQGQFMQSQDRGSKEESAPAKALGERVQWTSPDGIRFLGTGKSFDRLPPGYYDIGANPSVGIYFEKLTLRVEGIIDFPNTPNAAILAELQKFWDREARFKMFRLPFKRGILMFGPPGSGKTTIIARILEDVINREGIALKFTLPDLFVQGMKIIRAIQPDVPVVVVMEDIDTLTKILGESALLNVLDGAEDINRVVFLATTNYPELLGPRIINRPSRFDKRFQVPHPDDAGRRLYIESLAARGDHDPFDMDLWVKETKTMSMAHIKELWVATQVLGDSFETALETLKGMAKKISSEDKTGGGREMGFEKGN